MKIYFYGDFVPAYKKSVSVEWEPTSELKDGLHIFNLECPITSSSNKINKAGPYLKGNLEDVHHLKSIFPNLLFNVSNNHMLDYSKEGLEDTLDTLNELGINYIGYSSHENPYYDLKKIAFGSKNIGFLSASENQFGIKGTRKDGINGLFPELFEVVVEAKKEVDVLVVSIHAAAEMINFPSPILNKTYKVLLALGADIIWGHHSHVPQYREEIGTKCIIHGNGNSLLQPTNNKKQTNFSVVSVLDLDTNSWTDIGTELIERETGITWQRHSEIVSYLNQIKRICLNSDMHHALWQEHSIKMYENTYSKWIKKSFKGQLKRRFIRNEIIEPELNSSMIYHLFSCISHSNAIETALGVYCGEISDLRTDSSKMQFEAMTRKIVEYDL